VAESDQFDSPTRMRISQLMGMMRPAQAWAIVVLFGVVMIISFGFGYLLRSSSAKIDNARYEGQLALMQARTQNQQCLEAKEKFLGLYVRYLQAREAAEEIGTDHCEQYAQKTAVDFQTYLNQLMKRGVHERDVIDLRGLIVEAESEDSALVRFAFDGSSWSIPAEFAYEPMGRLYGQ